MILNNVQNIFNYIVNKTFFELTFNSDESYFYVNKIEICKFKALDNILPSFCLGSTSEDFTNNQINEISLKGAINNFSNDYGLIGNKNKLNIHDYLMKKNI